jgi:hypothetical protein
MTKLKNEFSWSKTRDEVFSTCPRQYWFACYGYWNGWLENAPARTRQIYILKNLKIGMFGLEKRSMRVSREASLI